MGSQPFDPSSDSLLVFASETPVAPAQDSEPTLLRTPTLGDAPHSIFALDHQEPQRSRVWPVATISVMVGFLAGFVAGYGFAHRAIVPAAASTPTARPASPGTSHTPRAERAPEPGRGPDIAAPAPAPALPSDARAVSVPSAPSSTTRPLTTERRGPATVPATVPTTGHAGAIEYCRTLKARRCSSMDLWSVGRRCRSQMFPKGRTKFASSFPDSIRGWYRCA